MATKLQTDAVRRFWQWFDGNVEQLKTLYLTGQFELLANEMNRELDRIEPQLAWEIGAGRTKPYLLAVSTEGNPQLRQIADLIVEGAPRLGEWEFYASRPSRPAPRAVQLPESGERFDTSEWNFIPIERPDRGQLDLVVVDDHLARADHESALRAISLYLDQVLGEQTVEEWIGTFKAESRVAAAGKKTYKMTELPDFLVWVTRRENNPLKKLAGLSK